MTEENWETFIEQIETKHRLLREWNRTQQQISGQAKPLQAEIKDYLNTYTRQTSAQVIWQNMTDIDTQLQHLLPQQKRSTAIQQLQDELKRKDHMIQIQIRQYQGNLTLYNTYIQKWPHKYIAKYLKKSLKDPLEAIDNG